MTRRARTTPRAPAIDVPIRETLLFVERHLPSTSRVPRAEILKKDPTFPD